MNITEFIKQICIDSNYAYGYRRVTQALANEGMTVNHKKSKKYYEGK
ncbi:IS3 family transposase [Staphylococcus chromogenes]